MDARGELGCRVAKADLEECEYLVFTLAALSEIVAWNGLGVLERIYRRTFDEADLIHEEIPIEHRYKVNLELLCNEFFGALIFAFQLIDDYKYACTMMEKYIRSRECSENTYVKMVLMYRGMYMIYKKSLPWEIMYHLQNVVGQDRSRKQCLADYKREGETYLECVKRYRSHWRDGE